MTITTADLDRLCRTAVAAPVAVTGTGEEAEAAIAVRARVTDALRWLPIGHAVPAVADALCDWAALDPDAVADAAARIADVARAMQLLREGRG